MTGGETSKIIPYVLFRSLFMSTFLSTLMTECSYIREIECSHKIINVCLKYLLQKYTISRNILEYYSY